MPTRAPPPDKKTKKKKNAGPADDQIRTAIRLETLSIESNGACGDSSALHQTPGASALISPGIS